MSKSGNLRRAKACLMADRNFCAHMRADAHNPFPAGSTERAAYAKRMDAKIRMDADLMEMFSVYGGVPPTFRDPASIEVAGILSDGH